MCEYGLWERFLETSTGIEITPISPVSVDLISIPTRPHRLSLPSQPILAWFLFHPCPSPHYSHSIPTGPRKDVFYYVLWVNHSTEHVPGCHGNSLLKSLKIPVLQCNLVIILCLHTLSHVALIWTSIAVHQSFKYSYTCAGFSISMEVPQHNVFFHPHGNPATLASIPTGFPRIPRDSLPRAGL